MFEIISDTEFQQVVEYGNATRFAEILKVYSYYGQARFENVAEATCNAAINHCNPDTRFRSDKHIVTEGLKWLVKHSSPDDVDKWFKIFASNINEISTVLNELFWSNPNDELFKYTNESGYTLAYFLKNSMLATVVEKNIGCHCVSSLNHHPSITRKTKAHEIEEWVKLGRITPSEAKDCMWQLESKTRQEKESQASAIALMGVFRRLDLPQEAISLAGKMVFNL